jgi:hypothetical protein
VSVRTTYSDLTGDAAEHLGRTLQLLDCLAPQLEGTSGSSNQVPEPGPEAAQVELCRAADAHRDLTAALVHLGRSLMEPISQGRPSGRWPGARGGDATLLTELAPHAAARDWTAPLPAPETPAGALTHAARLTRAAADLWSTHRCSRGGPRSPEASLMRHPSMLGAATREWRELIVLAGAIADRMVALAPPGTPDGQAWMPGTPGPADYPRPSVRRHGDHHAKSAAPATRVDLTVARPTPKLASDPLTAIRDRVDHLRRVAWMLAETGSAPIPILANTAAIGVMLASATARAHRASTDLLEPAHTRGSEGSDQARPDPDHHAEATGPETGAATADLLAQRWSDVARLVADLRSAHPSLTAIQVDRVDLARLLDQLMMHATGPGAPSIAESLSESLQMYAEVARHLAVAVHRAHGRGEIYLRGRALPANALPRRPELLEAKLADRPVPLPTSMIRELEDAYAELHRGAVPAQGQPRPRRGPGDRSPAA